MPAPDSRDRSALDHLGRRRLSGGEEAAWYGVAAFTYVAASIFEKGLLNWIIGPLWLVAVVWFGPDAYDAVRRRGKRQ